MTINNRSFPFRVLGLILLIATITFGSTMSNAWADSDKRVVKVMTQNVDAGTDLLWFFAPGIDVPTATMLTYQELNPANFSERAGLIADQIAIQQPYLIALQEVTLWQTISGTGEVGTIADQLNLLMDALAARHQHYAVVDSQDLTDLTAPLGDGGLRFLDRNVILARTDLKQSEMALSNIDSGIYVATITPLPGFTELNGWLSVDAKIRGKSLRFFCTHLETALGAWDDTQTRQGEELIDIMEESKIPVILAGDFNSDVSGLGVGPDQTNTAAMIVQAGYLDAWNVLHPEELGLTWPLYLEDMFTDPTDPFERIDLIFSRNLEIQDVEVIGNQEPFPSDHAGVVATLQIGKPYK